MAKNTTSSKKSRYQLRREELGLSREKASELLETIPPERIERIETGKYPAYPEEVLNMAEKYNDPQLCNFYCARECAIGQRYVPEVEVKHLSQIVLEMLASLNTMQRSRERLIEICSDGKVSDEQVEDFVRIQEELERISVTVEALQLWAERMLAEGKINLELYKKHKEGK